LYSTEDYTLQPGERKVFFVGFGLEFPKGYVATVHDKSSLPKNAGIHVMGGVYDAGYRGEYNVQLINHGAEAYQISKHDKIAQLLIQPVVRAELDEVNELNDSSRGQGRFGSTGK
jgi:dUTP pyrophosphatase